MNVSLPETMKEFGRQKVAIGNNESASQVVGEGLDLESRRENQIALGGRRRWLLPGTAQRNFALLFPDRHGKLWMQGVVSNRRSEPGLCVARVETNWGDINASFIESLPDNFELWRPPANNSEDEFVAKYTVNGMTFWDNNTGANTARPITVKRCAPLAISSEISLRRGTCSSIDPPIAAAVNSVRVARRSSDLIVRCRPTAGAARWSPFSYSVGPP
jgi:hypothetical protein